MKKTVFVRIFCLLTFAFIAITGNAQVKEMKANISATALFKVSPVPPAPDIEVSPAYLTIIKPSSGSLQMRTWVQDCIQLNGTTAQRQGLRYQQVFIFSNLF
jgi:hypothetical protein